MAIRSKDQRRPWEWVKMGTKQLGIATYFHGRRHILDRLKKIYKRGKTSDSTVLIVEGISGSGKTALMHQVAIEAAKHGWNPINVGGAVSDARSLASDLHGVTAHSRRALVVKIGRHTFIFGKDLGSDPSPTPTVERVLRHINKPTIMLYDGLHHYRPDATLGGAATFRRFVRAIESGLCGAPVIFLGAGNPTTATALSRIDVHVERDRVIDIGLLSDADGYALIHDWMVHEGGARGDINRWADAIMAESEGFMLFTNSYAQEATNYLSCNHGRMTEIGLRAVLSHARDHRIHYFDGYTMTRDASTQRAWRSKRNIRALLEAVHGARHGVVNREAVITALELYDGDPHANVADILESFMYAWVLEEVSDGVYRIPLKSLYYYLLDYVNESQPYTLPDGAWEPWWSRESNVRDQTIPY